MRIIMHKFDLFKECRFVFKVRGFAKLFVVY